MKEVNEFGEVQNNVSYAQLKRLVDIITLNVLRTFKSWDVDTCAAQPLVAVGKPLGNTHVYIHCPSHCLALAASRLVKQHHMLGARIVYSYSICSLLS